MRRSLLRVLAAAVVILLGVLSGTAFLSPPPALPASAPAAEFSAERAMRHVEALARAPRPVSSRGHSSARDYLLQELGLLGLRPQVQDTVSAFRFPGAEGFGAARVRNVLARIEGTGEGPAILLNAHYDGGNTGVAAADCGACVAAVLETARALTAGPPPRRDVIFVFSDAEEMGDHGAHAFATQHPWMRDVGLALNYESMGTTGPGTLYVTGPGNATLIDALAGATPRGFGSSFVTALFNAIPDMRNACDLQDYLDAGKPGLGFVLHGNTQRYHTVLDTPANLDPGSLQSFGDSALGMARAFGGRDLRSGENAVFFPLAPFGTVRFGEGLALPLALVTLALSLLLAWRGRDEGARLRGVASAALALPMIGAAAGAAATGGWAAMRASDPALQVFLVGTYATDWYVAGLSLVAAGVAMQATTWLLRRLSLRQTLAGFSVSLALIAVGLALSFPGMAYVAALPALAALPAVFISGRKFAGSGLFDLLPVFTIAALVAPLAAPSGMLTAFMVRLEAFSHLPMLGLPPALTALAVSFSFPFLKRYAAVPGTRVRPAAVLLSLAVVALAGGTIRSRFSDEQPRPEAVRYELNDDAASARWTSNDVSLGAWSGQFIPSGSPRLPDGSTFPGGPPTFAAQAPLFPLPTPTARILARGTQRGRQQVYLGVASGREAPIMEVRVSAGAPIVAAAIGGQALDFRDFSPARSGQLHFYASGFDRQGFELKLTLDRPASFTVELADMSDGLPGPPRRRPVGTMPTPGATVDGTVVRTTLRFEEGPDMGGRP